jgi:hypothetical protein
MSQRPFLSAVRRQFNRSRELVGTVTQRPPEPHDLAVKVVERLALAAGLGEQHRRAAREGLEVDAVRGHQRHDLTSERLLPAVVRQRRPHGDPPRRVRSAAVLFLRANRGPQTAAWWASAAIATDRPVIVGELLRDDSVVCDAREAHEAIAWAAAQPAWTPAAPAVWVEDPLDRPVEPVAPGVAP